MPTLYLIDGYAQFFRAYHAIRTPMTSPVTKEPTNMSFGFIGMMLKLLRGEGPIGGRPDYVACVIDVSGDKETFRSELYPDYKAHRPPPPEDLFPQVERCLATLRAMNVPVLGVEGFEADDVIATLVTSLRKQHSDLRIRIISKDKDLKQLLQPGDSSVELYDIHTDVVIDATHLKAETGLEPAQVIDMLSLMGDNVDNVPGVEGVGPKTAAELLATYGTMEAVLAAAQAGKIKGKRGEKIAAAASILPLSRQLVTLRHDAPSQMDLSAAKTLTFNLSALGPVLKELGFNRYQDELRALMGESSTHMPEEKADRRPDKQANGGKGDQVGGARSRSKAKDDGPSLFAESAAASGAPVAIADGRAPNEHYRCITTAAQLAALVKELKAAEIFAFDTETTGLSPVSDKLCGLSFSTKPGTGVYIPVRSPTPDKHLDEATVLAALKPVLEDPKRPKCGHNIKFDLMVLRAAGIELGGVLADKSTAFDSMVASFLIDASRSSHSLDALALALLGHTNISIKQLIGSGKDQKTFDCVPIDLATQYAAEDADVALRLRNEMLPQLRALGLMDLFEKVEMPLVRVLADLEYNGILVNAEELDRQRDRLQVRIDELREKIDSAAKAALGRVFNPDSPKQLAAALFNKADAGPGEEGLGLKPVKRTQTGYSTDVEVLEKLAEDPAVKTELPRLILDYRELTKLVSTYLVALKEAINPKTGRIHASFSQTVAVTGRLASSDPNLQNIPIRSEIGRDIRRAFIAPPGCVLISADYSQIELRLLAHLSQDPALIQAFMEDQDIHAAVAAQIHNIRPEEVSKAQRSGAKMVNFGIVYGITAFGLGRRLGIGNSEADEIIIGYKKRFAGITTFLQECVSFAQQHGYVETMLKRRRPIPDIHSNIPARRAFAERTAINSVVQGSAADLIKLAMVDLSRPGVLPEGVRMLLQIHDELVFESPKAASEKAQKTIVRHMEGAMKLSVPLKVDAGADVTWFEGE